MQQKAERFYPSAPSMRYDKDLDQRLEKKLKHVTSFNNSDINIKGMLPYLENKNTYSKKKYKKYKTLTTSLKSFGTIVVIATTSSSITFYGNRFNSYTNINFNSMWIINW